MNVSQLQQVFVLFYAYCTYALAMIWTKVARYLKGRDSTEDSENSATPTAPPLAEVESAGNIRVVTLPIGATKPSRSLFPVISPKVQTRSMYARSSQMNMRLAVLEDDGPDVPDIENDHESRAPKWFSGPRNVDSLPDIMQSIDSDNREESDYAFGEMLKLLDQLDNSNEVHIDLMKEAFDRVMVMTRNIGRDDCQSALITDHAHILLPLTSSISMLADYGPHLVDYLTSCLDSTDAFRRNASLAVGLLVDRKLLSEELLMEIVLPRVFEHANAGIESYNQEHRLDMTTVFCRPISNHLLTDRKWVFENFVWRYSQLLNNASSHIRKAAILVLGDLGQLLGERFTEMFCVPQLISMSNDANWGIRKCTCEVFVYVAKAASLHVRRGILAPRYVKMLNDPSRWVCFAAFQELGPFIMTFSDSLVTGISLNPEGNICVDDALQEVNGEGTPITPCPLRDMYDHIPDKTWMPYNEEDMGMDTDEDNSVYVLNNMYRQSYPKSTSVCSAPASVIGDDEVKKVSVAAKCSSYENLSDLGIGESNGMYDSDDEFGEDDDDVVDLNTTQLYMSEDSLEDVVEDASLDMEGDDGTKTEQVEGESMESVADDTPTTNGSNDDDVMFSPTFYWKSSFFSFDNDELVDYGYTAGTVGSNSHSEPMCFLSHRLDILNVSPPRDEADVSPVSISPVEASCIKTAVTVESESEPDSGVSSSVEPETNSSPEPIEMLDDESDSFMPFPGKDEEEDAERMETDMVSSNGQVLVPQELVDMFMTMSSSTNGGDADINMYCAHNFPAVAYTLGRAHWPRMKDMYMRLANDDNMRVRVSIASSLHHVAKIVGTVHADADVLPVFLLLKDDTVEVRCAILDNLSEFIMCLSPKMQNNTIPVFCGFMNVLDSSKWRLRSALSEQCLKLCNLYDVTQINSHLVAIALILANDKAAVVRKEAVVLVSLITSRLVGHEWPSEVAGETSDISSTSCTPLTDAYVSDMYQSFCKSLLWKRRQTFALVCERILADRSMTEQQFAFYLLPGLLTIVKDKQAVVRIAVCRAIGLLSGNTQAVPMDDTEPKTVISILQEYAKDLDMDVAREARRALGLSAEPDLIDVTERADRLRRREDSLIQSRFGSPLDTSNYDSVDMDISSA